MSHAGQGIIVQLSALEVAIAVRIIARRFDCFVMLHAQFHAGAIHGRTCPGIQGTSSTGDWA